MNRRSALALSGAITGAALLGALPERSRAGHANEAPDGAKPYAVFVIRHTERLDDSADSELSGVGRQRADRVGAMLRSAGVLGVLHSETVRTRATGQRILDASDTKSGATIRTYDARKPASMVRGVIEQGSARGGAWVIVGHSNTVPALVRAFGGDPGTDELEHDAYDDLFMVVRAGGVFSLRLRT